MSAYGLSICVCVLIAAMQIVAQGAIGVKVLERPASTQPAKFGRMEWTVNVEKTFDNPFDPDELAVDAEFVGPDGQKLRVPGFWTLAFEHHAEGRRDRMTPVGQAHWAVRFCPAAAGTWIMRVVAKSKDDSGQSDVVKFDVAPSSNPGFVRRVADNPRYFQFDDGSPFFMVGLNICWGDLKTYETDFAKLQSVGGNFARLWLSNRALESNKTGIGKYDLENAAYYDAVLETAERHGIRCMAALGTYGQLTAGGFFGEGKWNVNPYNTANGGPATQPADAFSPGIARDYYKRQLRYLIARYGSYSNLAFWEFWNEQDLAGGAIAADWTCEMAVYLKQHDPYGRLVTTSFSGAGEAAVWNCPEIDLTQSHIYGDHETLLPAMYDRTPSITSAVRRDWKFNKPTLIGELGICWRDNDKQHDPANTGTNLHNGLWAAAFSGAAGSGMYWWWDNYVAPRDQWKQFAGFAAFVKTIDWPKSRFQPIDVPMPEFKDDGPAQIVDRTIYCGASSSRRNHGPVDIRKDGTTSAEIPGLLAGPDKDGVASRVDINLTVDHPTPVLFRIAHVIDRATLRVDVDHEPMAEWSFNAAPGSADVKDSHPLADRKDVYRATVQKAYGIVLPPGRRTISLWVSDGDTLGIESITLISGIAGRYTGLRVLALRDASTGQTIAWVNDRNSNCGDDATGQAPREYKDAAIVVPTTGNAPLLAAWWDTRSGKIISKSKVQPSEGKLSIAIPAFTRDIALNLSPNL